MGGYVAFKHILRGGSLNMSASREETRVKLLLSLGYAPGVSAWFSVWQLARLGKPAAEVWGGQRRRRRAKARIGEHCHP